MDTVGTNKILKNDLFDLGSTDLSGVSETLGTSFLQSLLGRDQNSDDDDDLI